jgi:Tfp pilus assembly protein PilF
LYPPLLLSRVHRQKMNGELYLRKSISRFTFHFELGNLIRCSTGKPAVETTPEAAVGEVFNWGMGTYSFVASSPGGRPEQADGSATTKLILDRVRAIGNLFLVEEALGRSKGLVRPAKIQIDARSCQLLPVESFLLSRIHGPCTVEELCLVSPVIRHETMIGIYVLVCAGLVDSGSDPLLLEPAANHVAADGGLPGPLRSFSALGPTRPPVQVHPSYSRARQRVLSDEVVIGTPSNNNRREHAASIFGSAITENKDSGGLEEARSAETMDMARYHFEKGLEHYARKDFHRAVQLFRLAVKIDDRKAEYHRYLALALSRNPNWAKQAEQALLRAVELEPEHAETHYFLGRIYLDSGLPARAMSRFRESLRIDPDLKPARLELAVLNGAARDVERDQVAPALLCRK